MSQCVLCNTENATYPLYKNSRNNVYICYHCQQALTELFRTAETQDYGAYIACRDLFGKHYGSSPYAAEITAKSDGVWEAAHVTPEDELKPVQVEDVPDFAYKEEPPVQRSANPYAAAPAANAAPPKNPADASYYPNKLMLSTVLGLIALFMPVLGLIPAIIAKNMADEIPFPFCVRDVTRARNISFAAIVLCVIEFFAGLVTMIVLFATVF